jgi:hypothetical protein
VLKKWYEVFCFPVFERVHFSYKLKVPYQHIPGLLPIQAFRDFRHPTPKQEQEVLW